MKQRISAEQKDEWHEDPKNWFLGFMYFNRQDHRVLVSKKNPYMGWTINFANLYSYFILTMIIAFIFLMKIHNS